jgi:hypothetical protein
MFWFLAKQYAMSRGVLPSTSWFQKLLSIMTLERLVILGGLMSVLGLAGLLRATLYWGSASFGHLDYMITLREVVPSTTLIVLGLQIVFFGFLTSLLKLGLTPRED